MSSSPFVRVITVNYDGGDVTLRCLKALQAQSYPRDRFEIVVVDNGSIDGLSWKIPRVFPDVRLIESFSNEGFARGNNLAMDNLGGVDFVALINNDAIPEACWLEELVRTASLTPAIGAVSSKMLFNKRVIGFDVEPISGCAGIGDVLVNGESIMSQIQADERARSCNPTPSQYRREFWTDRRTSLWADFNLETNSVVEIEIAGNCDSEVVVHTDEGSIPIHTTSEWSRRRISVASHLHVINNAGGGLFKGFYGGDIGFRELDFGQYDKSTEVFSFCGGAVLLNSHMLLRVGLFDPSFFLYYEDLDLAWRARSAGWTLVYEPNSVVYHEHAFSSIEGSDFFNFWVDRNRRLTLIKNAPLGTAVQALLGSIVLTVRDCMRILFRGSFTFKAKLNRLKVRLRQLASFLKVVPIAALNRWRIGRRSTVDRTFVRDWMMDR